MTAPSVFVAWGQSPLGFNSVTATWTDISSDVLDADGVEIGRGRQDESGDVEASTLTFRVRNDAGAYTPGFQGGDNWPDVVRFLPIKVEYDSVIRFVGFADEFTVEWPGLTRDYATVEITASGLMRRLSQTAALQGTLQEEILALAPAFYYPCTDPLGAGSLSDISGNQAKPIDVPWSLGADTDTELPGLERQAVPNVTNGQASTCVPGVPITVALGCSFVFWFKSDEVANLSAQTISDLGLYIVALNDEWEFRAGYTDVADTGLFETRSSGAFGNADACDNQWHQFAIVFDGVTNIDYYFDGSFVATTTVGFASPIDLGSFTLGIGYGDTRSITHVAGFNTELSASDILNLYIAAATAFSYETVDARVTRLATYENEDVTISTSAINLAAQECLGGTALEIMRATARSDNGFLYETLDGHLGYEPGATRNLLADGQPYLVLDGASSHVRELQPVYDDQKLTNQSTVTSPAGSGTAENTDSVNAYAARGTDLDTFVSLQSFAQDYAEWLANVNAEVFEGRADATPRVPQVTFLLHANPDLLTDWHAGDPLGKRLTITSPPPQMLGPVELVIEGYTERITNTTYDVTVNCSPLIACWVVEDATLGVLHPEGHVLYADITDSATSMTVVVPTESPAWLTTGSTTWDTLDSWSEWVNWGAEFPDLDLDGERVTVSAITALSSGRQTFTITRGTGGTTPRAHSALTPVQLWAKHVVALG